MMIMLNKSGATEIKIMVLRLLANEVIGCVYQLNPEYLHEIFAMKNRPSNFRDTSILDRLRSYTTKYCLESCRKFGAKL